MPATIALARAGGTVGEWAGALREVFGEYRAPTGVGGVTTAPIGDLQDVRQRARAAARDLGGPIRLLVGKPGLDGHSNGAEQLAVAARDAGLEVIYQGIRLTPAQIAAAARDEDVDVVGPRSSRGRTGPWSPRRSNGSATPVSTPPCRRRGIIPDADRDLLTPAGVSAIYTPKDFRLATIVSELVDLAIEYRKATRAAARAG